MTTLDSPPRQRLSVTRRVIGVVIGIVLLADVVAYGAARIDPRNVFLRSHFYSYVTGVGIMFAGMFVGMIAAFPIRNSATQRLRPFIRLALFFLAVLTLITAAIMHGFSVNVFQPHYVAAVSPNGKLQATMVSNSKWDELHIFTGSGLGQKDLGDIGAPCNLDKIRFVSDTSLSIASTDGDNVLIPLDPGTGAPLRVLQRTCAFDGA